MKLFPAHDETIHGTAEQIRARQKSCVDVLEACLERIDRLEPRVQAWVRVDRAGARASARQLDDELAAGRWRGPLHGIPIGIKDIFDVRGMPTMAGWPLWADRVAAEDAPIVAQLRAAGAVIVGKTVTTQFASFDPPVTRNPWNLDRTPGGSSSGSAAAVACGMCLGAIGSQTGGSITRPASFCGVAGCKPSYGRLHVGGVVALAPSMDHPGPIARTVRDLALLLDAMTTAPAIERSAAPGETRPLADDLEDEPLQSPRLGRLRGLFDQMADEELRQAIDRALESCRGAGAEVQDAELPPSFDEVLHNHGVIMAVEAAAYHEERFREARHTLLPKISRLIAQGLDTPRAEYERCRQHQKRLAREMARCFEAADVLVTPATTSVAPDITSTGDPAFNSPWSYTGLPTVSLPIALSADKLPIAMQLIGRHGDEPRLFRVSAWCERVLAATAPLR